MYWFLQRSLIILVRLPMRLFSEKMMISYISISSLMPNSHKISWMVSSKNVHIHWSQSLFEVAFKLLRFYVVFTNILKNLSKSLKCKEDWKNFYVASLRFRLRCALCRCTKLLDISTKSQILSKANFLVLIWTKNPTKLFFDFCPSL